MCNSPHIRKIRIFEPFAGMGQDENNEKGSASKAAEVIERFRTGARAKGRTDIRLFLNELDFRKYESLKNSMEQYKDFVRVTNHKASEFLSQVHSALKGGAEDSHNLFFLDPYGYTQYSKKNLNDMLDLGRSDYLIFIPTNHIYRFSGTETGPARQFVLDIGVSESNLKSRGRIDEFAAQLTKQLKNKARTQYGYNYKLVNVNAPNSVFHLFFITKHVRGAEKFLQAVDKIKEQLRKQLDLVSPLLEEVELTKILAAEKTNEQLFDAMIQRGYLPKKYMTILKQLERDNKLGIRCDFPRRRGSFYLTSQDKTIHILLKDE